MTSHPTGFLGAPVFAGLIFVFFMWCFFGSEIWCSCHTGVNDIFNLGDRGGAQLAICFALLWSLLERNSVQAEQH